MYQVAITVNEPQVVVSDTTTTNITITSDNSLFTITNVVNSFTVTNVSPVVVFDAEGGAGFDFAFKNKGPWVSGTYYNRNDVVQYQNSIYICSVLYFTEFLSGTNPKDDSANWELFYYNEWTKSFLTITNTLNVGDIISTGTFKTRAINGLGWPDKGLYGQVLTTNGVSTATWVNLGDLVYWSLSNDLITNGFNITSGGASTDLVIGTGTTGLQEQRIEFLTDTAKINAVAFAGMSISNGTTNVIDIGNNQIDTYKKVVVHTRMTGAGGDQAVIPVSGLNFPDGSNQTTAAINYSLPSATNSTLGGIKVGTNLSIDGNGVLSADAGSYTLPSATDTVLGGIKVGQRLSISNGVLSADATTLSIASSTVLGGIKVGDNLVIDGNGVLSANTATSFILPKATTGILGGIIVGENLTITAGGILNANTGSGYSLPVASNTVLGGVKIYLSDNGLDINNTTGALSVSPATDALIGGIRVGDNLNITETGVLSVNTNSNWGKVSLSQEMDTNGYKIRYNQARADDSFVDVNTNNINIHSGSVTIESPITQLGTSAQNSTLYIGKIYNYEGTYAPFFPAGIQFNDQTVQRTAFEPDQGLLP